LTKKNFFSGQILTLSHFLGWKQTFSICNIIYRLILTFGCWIWIWTRFHDIFTFLSGKNLKIAPGRQIDGSFNNILCLNDLAIFSTLLH
jgi:hypothetical protein